MIVREKTKESHREEFEKSVGRVWEEAEKSQGVVWESSERRVREESEKSWREESEKRPRRPQVWHSRGNVIRSRATTGLASSGLCVRS